MNTTYNVEHRITKACLASCQKLVTRIQRAKAAVLAQFRDLKEDHEQALRLALNEAEALAWDTPYPQLVFADLAEEKVRALAEWSKHQRAILHRRPLSAAA